MTPKNFINNKFVDSELKEIFHDVFKKIVFDKK